jgi:hypothetical protein
LKSLGAGLLQSLTHSNDQKSKGKILLSKSKERGEIKICKEKELKKHLSIAKKRRITGDKQKNNQRQQID